MVLSTRSRDGTLTEPAVVDLGPLAWVLEELRKAVGGATRSLRRFLAEAEALEASEHHAADTAQLRLARQQLHQAAGAMDMVGQEASARLLRSMETAVQFVVQHPEQCTEAWVNTLERASFGLLQFLEAVLQGKPVSAVALYPQYREVQALSKQERAHPADLWTLTWRWAEPAAQPGEQAQAYLPALRSRFEQAVLKFIKSGDAQAARLMSDLSVAFAAAQTVTQPKVFWRVCAGFFEALSQGLCPVDVHVKRAVSRVLQQYSQLVKGELGVADRLVQDLVFFCAQAQASADSPRLQAVREAFGLTRWQPVDYEASPFGQFDPAVLAQARKRIAAVKEVWSSIAGGDLIRMRGLTDQFNLLADSLVRLHPPSAPLAKALIQAAEATVRSGDTPSAGLAMEVATSIMFLEAEFEELDPTDPYLAQRTARLAQRLQRVQNGADPEALEPWIEELYRRVSDRQTMGSVVGELRTALNDLERVLDPYFRQPQDASVLVPIPGQLSQMRGVLSVLGLDHAVRAVQRMRETVERMLDTEVDAEQARLAGTFDKLGNNLGALGLLFDMLSYQPTLAKKLFVFDDTAGELRPVMGRSAEGAAESVAAAMAPEPERDVPQVLHQFLPTNFSELPPSSAEPNSGFAATQFASSEWQRSGGWGPTQVAPLADAEPVQPLLAHEELALPVQMTVPAPATAKAAAPAPQVDDEDALEEDDLLDIFLEEAREVLVTGTDALQALADSPADVEQLTVLRRAFHTLKGSSRMVGLQAFGEAAWSMEQVLNTWLADRRPATPELRTLATEAFACFSEWLADIAAGRPTSWVPARFQTAADALRIENRLLPIRPASPPALVEPAAVEAPSVREALPEQSAFAVAQAPEPVIPEPAAGPEPLEVLEPTLAQAEELTAEQLPADAFPDIVWPPAEATPPQPEAAAAADAVLAEDLSSWPLEDISGLEVTEAEPALPAAAMPMPVLAVPDLLLDALPSAQHPATELAPLELVSAELVSAELAPAETAPAAQASDQHPPSDRGRGESADDLDHLSPGDIALEFPEPADAPVLVPLDLLLPEDAQISLAPASMPEPAAPDVPAPPSLADLDDLIDLADLADLAEAPQAGGPALALSFPEWTPAADVGRVPQPPGSDAAPAGELPALPPLAEEPLPLDAPAASLEPEWVFDIPDAGSATGRVSGPAEPPVPAQPLEPAQPVQALPTSDDARILAEFEAEVAASQAKALQPLDEGPLDAVADGDDEQIKLIDGLRISIPLYNVFLNEADEWSRRLLTELSEWALELQHRGLADSSVALAHSLAGSSATVGFQALSGLARELEHAMRWTQLQNQGTAEEGEVYLAAAEDIRRLLHQFAAGFLKQPNPDILRALQSLHADKGPLPKQAPPVWLDDELGIETAPDAEGAALQAWDLPAAADLPEPLESPLSVGADASEQAPAPGADAEAGLARADLPPAAEPVDTAVEPPALLPQARTRPEDRLQALLSDDALESTDVLDPDLFPVFQEEATELLPQLAGALRQWVARPDNVTARAEVLRVLHTLKGSARLAGAMRLGEQAHRMESAVEWLDATGLARDAQDIEPLLAGLDALQAHLDSLHAPADRTLDSALDSALAANGLGVPEAEPDAVPAGAEVLAGATTEVAHAGEGEGAPAQPTPAAGATAPGLPAPAVAAAASRFVPPRPASGQAVRIRSQLLDTLVNQTGEVMMTRSRLESGVGQMRASLADLSGNLDRLRQQLRDMELQAELQMQSRLAKTRDTDRSFDPLEFDRFTRVQELTRMMAESVNDVATVQRNLERSLDSADADLVAQARQTRELQRDLLRTRMQEFETIAERLYRVVRQAAKESDKQVKLEIIGGAIEMDRGVLDRMTPAFEHLLRNAVSHGIESPDERVSAGKPASGTIAIRLTQDGNDVVIAFSDDGAGLDGQRIRAKAVAQGMVGEQQVLTPDDLINLIFMPGFSTATEVTELAGRGIGMDVVRSEVLALGGRIESGFEPGQGTQFRLVLPLTTAVTQVVMIRVGRLSFGLPANLVELIRRTPQAELEQAYHDQQLVYQDDALPFFWAGALLQTAPASDEPVGKTASVLVLRSAQQRMAMHVDEVLGNQEVVVKNLGPQLSRLPGLSGMTVLASGAVVLIYNPVALAAVYGPQIRSFQAPYAPSRAPSAGGGRMAALQAPATAGPNTEVPLILVVDDSITVRRVTQRLLRREGYRVALAVDGVQALEQLRTEVPAVVLSDIEMPRMDGFELARALRASPRWKSLPIVMISSRTADKHRQVAKDIGVNHYLGKPYSEDELLGLIRQYARPTLPA